MKLSTLNKLLCLGLFCLSSTAVVAQTRESQIEVEPLAKNYYVHTSYNLYKNQLVPSNGLVVVGDTSVLLIDTAWGSLQTEQLLAWIKQEVKKPVSYCVVTHAHEDRTGGYQVLQQNNIPIIAASQTAALSEELGRPLQGITFARDTTIALAGIQGEVYYPGKGHSPDNRVIWFADQKILFGGCLVKSTQASSMGNVADADLQAWPQSIRQLYQKYGAARYVVPGHQQWGGIQLLTHTLELLKKVKQ